ncbi:hypothetical protein V6Z12_A07G201000 [Gossypium hirsutum]
MHLKELDKQVSKLALTVSRLQSQGKLALTLKSGKVLELVHDTSRGHDTSHAHDASQDREKLGTEAPVESALQRSFAVPPLFPGRLVQCKKERDKKEILETFRKLEINIPLLDAIKLLGNEKVSVGENVSTLLQQKIFPKYKNQCMFSISCKIVSVGIKKAMCDLGASINVMPLSIYKLLNAGPLKETGVIIQLVDRSVVHPEGVLEDVLVKVNELIFPTDFYIIDMEDDNSANASDILLGRPFLSTAQKKIDVRSGILTMEFDGEVVKFNVYEAMNRPSMISNVSNIDIIDPLTELHLEYHDKDELQTVLCRSLNFDVIKKLDERITIEDSVHETVAHIEASQLWKASGSGVGTQTIPKPLEVCFSR